MRSGGPDPRPPADGGPPNVALVVFVLAGGLMLALQIQHFAVTLPADLAENRRVAETVGVDARVAEHRDARGSMKSARGGGQFACLSQDIRVEYPADGEPRSAWVRHAGRPYRGSPPAPEPGDDRPPVGATCRVWYHPSAPGEPALREPRAKAVVFPALFVALWCGLFVLAGAGCVWLGVRRFRAWRADDARDFRPR